MNINNIDTTMKENKFKSTKANVFYLLRLGQTHEDIKEKTGIPTKIIKIWHLQNNEYKQNRLNILQMLLEYCSSIKGGVFSSGQRILINQERGILLRESTLTEAYKYPENLKTKIEFTLTKFKK